MKRVVASLIAAFALSVFLISVLFASQPPVPDDMILKPPPGTEAKQPPVTFSHQAHKDLECQACHHTWDGKGEIQSCAAQGCHDIFEAETPAERRDPKFNYNAWHDRKSTISCVGCHSEMRKAGEPTGPVGCKDCHQ
jgi:hypothetical protein